jgi:hypothetical protein
MFNNREGPVNRFQDLEARFFELKKLYNELTVKINSLNYQIQNHNENIINNNENHEDLDKFVTIEEGDIPTTFEKSENNSLIRYYPDHSEAIILNKTDQGNNKLLKINKSNDYIGIGFGNSYVCLYGKIIFESNEDGIVLRTPINSTTVNAKKLKMEENGIRFSPHLIVTEDGDKNDISISNGLRFVFDASGNKLMIKKPGVISGTNSQSSDISLSFDTNHLTTEDLNNYVTNQELNNKHYITIEDIVLILNHTIANTSGNQFTVDEIQSIIDGSDNSITYDDPDRFDNDHNDIPYTDNLPNIGEGLIDERDD